MGKVLSIHHLKKNPILVCKTFSVGDVINVVCEKGSFQCKDFEVSPIMTLYNTDEEIGILVKDTVDFTTLGNPIEVR